MQVVFANFALKIQPKVLYKLYFNVTFLLIVSHYQNLPFLVL